MDKVNRARLAMEQESQRVRMEGEMKTAELERVIKEDWLANKLKINTEKRANLDWMNSTQQWVQQQQAQQTVA